MGLVDNEQIYEHEKARETKGLAGFSVLDSGCWRLGSDLFLAGQQQAHQRDRGRQRPCSSRRRRRP